MGNPFSIKDMLTAFSAANKRTFAHDRTKSVGGSDVGQCIRKTWLGKHIATHGFTPDEDFVQSSGATDRGSVYENEVWAPALKAHRPEGAKLLFAGGRRWCGILRLPRRRVQDHRPAREPEGRAQA